MSLRERVQLQGQAQGEVTDIHTRRSEYTCENIIDWGEGAYSGSVDTLIDE